MTATPIQDPRGSATQIVLENGYPKRTVRHCELLITTPSGAVTRHHVQKTFLRIGSAPGNDIVIDDPTVSRLHCELRADEEGFRLRDLNSSNGTWVGGYRVYDLCLRPNMELRLGKTVLCFRPLEQATQIPTAKADRLGGLIGTSLAMRELYAMLQKIGPSEATVLITGETGTGKEMVAETVHQLSKRSKGPFEIFDCAAVPARLIESELFGHEKGAFTGAVQRRTGRFEAAHRGTLFIDELGELPLELQPKLLRVLESQQVQRVGGERSFPVDVRIIAATHRDLSSSVNQGSFRADLYFRLAVATIELPPLRKRREDIPLLIEHFLRQLLPQEDSKRQAILTGLSGAGWEKLKQHSWPGNVRELRNVVARTVALHGLQAEDPIDTLQVGYASPSREPETPPPEASFVDLDREFGAQKTDLVTRFERAYLQGQLDRYHGNYSRAARAAGLDRMYFKRLLKKYR